MRKSKRYAYYEYVAAAQAAGVKVEESWFINKVYSEARLRKYIAELKDLERQRLLRFAREQAKQEKKSLFEQTQIRHKSNEELAKIERRAKYQELKRERDTKHQKTRGEIHESYRKIRDRPLQTKDEPYKFTTEHHASIGRYTYNVSDLNTDMDVSGDIPDVVQYFMKKAQHDFPQITKNATMQVIPHGDLYKNGDEMKHWAGKKVPVVKLDDWKGFLKMLEEASNHLGMEGYDWGAHITSLRIHFFTADHGSGGGDRDIRFKIKDARGDKVEVFSPKNDIMNNCLFRCLYSFMKMEDNTTKFNEIRRELGLQENCAIDFEDAIKVMEKVGVYGKVFNVLTRESRIRPAPPRVSTRCTVLLSNNHYCIVNKSMAVKCGICDKVFTITHECSSSHVSIKAVRNGERIITMTKKNDTMDFSDDVVPFDIETWQKLLGNKKVATCYIVGYAFGRTGEFKWVETMAEFVRIILEEAAKRRAEYKQQKEAWESEHEGKQFKGQERMVYLNAFNGAAFDHLEFMKELRKQCKDFKIGENTMKTSAGIIKTMYKNIVTIDLYRHTLSKLDDVLKSLKLPPKGKFDHKDGKPLKEMTPEMKNKCIEYLKQDVVGLQSAYNTLNDVYWNEYKTNISTHVSLSAFAFQQWKRMLTAKQKINLPTLEQEKNFRQAIYGGRVYPTKSHFKSSQFDDIIAGKVKWDGVVDYVRDMDVVSMYPGVMQKELFPIGKGIDTDVEVPGKMGIYKVSYTPPNTLTQAAIPRKENGRLYWDLKTNTGWYSTVMIEDMRKAGYEVKVHNGTYWEKTDRVFKTYIDHFFAKKKAAQKGTALYTIAKLMMNSLYGKMCQKPVFKKSREIRTIRDRIQFMFKYRLLGDQDELDDGAFIFHGEEWDPVMKEENITKPTHLGVFILDYSKRLWWKYYMEAKAKDPTNSIESDPFYTDTDSLHFHAKYCPKMNEELGGLSDDLANKDHGKGKIIRALYIAPKLYALMVMYQDGHIGYHIRSKGVPGRFLTFEMFEKMYAGGAMTGEIDVKGEEGNLFRRVFYKRTKAEIAAGVPALSIHHETLHRRLNKTKWKGRHFIGNVSYPHGHILTTPIEGNRS